MTFKDLKLQYIEINIKIKHILYKIWLFLNNILNY